MDLPMYLHLDLKGAPPLLSYLEQLLPWLQERLHLRGLLVEYEDQFPFKSPELQVICNSKACWSDSDLKRFLTLTSSLGLEVIPLVQTLGHMEYVLKHQQFAHLRELQDMVECLSVAASSKEERQETLTLLHDILEEILARHPDCRSIHVGGDEVWHLAKGERSARVMAGEDGLTPSGLYLRHMEAVVATVRALRPGIEVLIWDDMIRSVPIEELKIHAEFLGQVRPVVWQYTATLNFPEGMWQKYRDLFPGGVYAASAFKGASSSCAKIVPITQHVHNHLAWLDTLRREGGVVQHKGLVLTGWQRFDHFAVLCELLPVAIPSLVCCVRSFRNGQEDVPGPLDQRSFPGADLFLGMQRFVAFVAAAEEFLSSDYVRTWCSDWQLETAGRLSALHARGVRKRCAVIEEEGNDIAGDMEKALEVYFPRADVEEWLHCFVKTILKRLGGLRNKLQSTA